MGRKPAPVAPETVEALAAKGLTVEEVADLVGLCRQSVHRRFQAELTRGRARMVVSLRRAQYLRATRDKSDRMLIWLGRCYLGQGREGGDGEWRDVLAEIGGEGG